MEQVDTGLAATVKLMEHVKRGEGGAHYVGPAGNRPPPSFRVVVDCHEGYMLILHLGDEKYVKLVWVARSLSQLKFGNSSPHFQQFQVGVLPTNNT